MYSGFSLEDFATFLTVLKFISIMLTLFQIIVGLLAVVANWHIFKKAGRPGWAAVIPFYNLYVMADITWGNGWLSLVVLTYPFIIFFAPTLSWICGLLLFVFGALTCWKLSKAFGHDIGFAICLILFPTIFSLILAFNDDAYTGVPQRCFYFNKSAKQ